MREKEKQEEIECLLWAIQKIARNNPGSHKYYTALKHCKTSEEVRAGMNQAIEKLAVNGHQDYVDLGLYRSKFRGKDNWWADCLEIWERIKELECQ
jgi:hypothetical protein